ncbi:MAG: hypothetical protein K2X81_17565 [Candidatus Obscuribacterales bacterium]|nr:hypothetical protein [Candidatus Obscuribacterales bacterium]
MILRLAAFLALGGAMLSPVCLAKSMAPAGSGAEAKIADLSFMHGTWVGKNESGAYVEEYWSKPKDDSLVGHCRFIKEGKTSFLELLEIVKSERGIVLRMKHLNGEFVPWAEKDESGDARLTEFKPDYACFDNEKAEHQVKVIYKRISPKVMSVVVEDKQDGKSKIFPFEYNLAD